ncbi:2-deoxy-D-gluconate 3-dehydrogenase [Trichophyton rubrum D6]|uniref:2-deoxy-D-gluconate 3-dehydrogenase n=5 Tax=Trichophyton TaxID=5550 RepID=A0A178F732_TRIRU|nr:2-deoxy-D-gluconate 3-dehydrogenase [Trichophyton rubrum MR850]EZF45443.1 2-deoxy-D-gluconate 3-dehydrogenase [Trichophyton rubrum CBS 100081]EZF56096.1 2-deoxy-D-gluconate 3-dehydrogenase [Trichophyton rubrum CBS 288.86]EZF66787.1 2-deoxy-D-gluconate 3-dehydrogenase [Trichophyton rubrum CBS 289.86]EZF77333.1 2-deoxy-D-gluconate 3-dehydrogenase [Trichophyton soudanense CBS 452.61]EZF88104.1 2-deoxy-D-gluconate 3-dehydrogenase [Trichophyton rubrum MR1448]EZG20483.1 2-deoxy-D-gluconate 3-deh
MATANVLSLFSLQGKTALVTGGSRGIGRAMAVGLAEAGADIILVQRDTSNTQTRDEILQKTAGKSKVTIHAAELSDRTAAKAIVSSVTADGTAVDILLNCAGIQRRHPSEAFPDQDWDEILQVNLSAVFTLCREFGAYLLSRGASGSIINMGSLLSYQGGITVPAYAASKGGIAQLTKALSNEWAAKGIRVNAIAPGYIDTDMNTALIQDPVRSESISARIPAGRWGKPEDFKGIAVFLASDASAYVSGEMVNVDGGWMGR